MQRDQPYHLTLQALARAKYILWQKSSLDHPGPSEACWVESMRLKMGEPLADGNLESSATHCNVWMRSNQDEAAIRGGSRSTADAVAWMWAEMHLAGLKKWIPSMWNSKDHSLGSFGFPAFQIFHDVVLRCSCADQQGCNFSNIWGGSFSLLMHSKLGLCSAHSHLMHSLHIFHTFTFRPCFSWKLCFVLRSLRVSFMPGQVHRATAASTQPCADASWKETTDDGGAAGEKKVQLPQDVPRCYKMSEDVTLCHKITHTVQALCIDRDSISGMAPGMMIHEVLQPWTPKIQMHDDEL